MSQTENFRKRRNSIKCKSRIQFQVTLSTYAKTSTFTLLNLFTSMSVLCLHIVLSGNFSSFQSSLDAHLASNEIDPKVDIQISTVRYKMAKSKSATYLHVLLQQEEGRIADPLLPNSDNFSILSEYDVSRQNREPLKRSFHIPWFMTAMTLIQIGAFVFTRISGENPHDSIFAFDPERISEAWRFVSYAVLHQDTQHLRDNLSLQLH